MKRLLQYFRGSKSVFMAGILLLVIVYLYAKYQYLEFLFLIFIVLGILIFLCEKIFGYPIPLQIEISNKSLPDARRKISDLISMAQREIIIVSGWLNHQVYDSDEFLEVFERLSHKIGGKLIDIKIYITEDEIDPDTVKFTKLLLKYKIPVYSLQFNDQNRINHCILVDSNHIRLEENHKRNATERKALIRYTTPYLVGKTKRLLEKVINVSQVNRIDLNSINSRQEV